jgi:hypothetical protein
MTDDPMSEVEILNAMRNMAKMARTLYDELVEQGFSEDQAMKLVAKYVHGAGGGKTE